MNRPQSGLCDALAKHFGLHRKTFREKLEQDIAATGGDAPAIDIDVEHRRFRVGVSKDTTRIGELFSFRHLAKKEVYPNLLDMFDNEMADFVVMYSNSTLLAVGRDENYRGVGGIFVREPGKQVGFYFEPIANYLKYHYPVNLEE
jgi:hypothetical protein